MTRSAQLAAVALVVVLTTAVVVAAREHDGDDAIPWIDIAPSPANLSRPTPLYVPRIPAGAAPCGARDIRLRALGRQGLNSGTIVFYIEVRNVGRSTCVIDGGPSVTIPERTPTRIAVQSTQVAFGPDGFPARGAAFGLRPGRIAGATVFNGYSCSDPLTERLEVDVRFGYATKGIKVPVLACRDSGGALSVAPFAPAESPEEPKPLRWPLEAELELPQSAFLGGVLEYRVKLKNISAHPFRFPFCPTYEVVVGRGDPIGVLNCRPMGTLAPGAIATFAMRMPLSRHFRPGRHTVVWTLADETLEDGVVARGKLEIERR